MTMIKTAWWLVAFALLAFAFAGGSSKGPTKTPNERVAEGFQAFGPVVAEGQ